MTDKATQAAAKRMAQETFAKASKTTRTVRQIIEADGLTTDSLVGFHFIDDELVLKVVSYAKDWYTSETADGVQQKDRANTILDCEFATENEWKLQAASQDGDDDEEEGRKHSQAEQLRKYRANYVVSVSASGSKSLHNGDSAAEAMEYLILDELYVKAGKILPNISESELRTKYAHLNKGSQRMNIGNRIRAQYKKGEEGVVLWVEDRLGDK